MNKLSKIALGTVQFGMKYGISNKSVKPNKRIVSEILDIAIKNNIRIIDTASAYGVSEKVLGDNDLSLFKMISKFMPQDLNMGVEYALDMSLKRLNIKGLYGYLAHRPDSVNNQLWDELLNLKSSGKVQKIGFSFQTLKEVEEIIEKGFMPDLIQIPFNYFDTRFSHICESLKKNNVEIHSRSTFLQGLFFTNVGDLSNHFNPVKDIISQLQNEYGKKIAYQLLKYVDSMEFIDHIVIGVQSKLELLMNLNYTKASLELRDLEILIPDSILNPALWK